MNKRGVLATIKSSGGGYTYKRLKHLDLFTFAALITSIISFSVLCNVLFNTNNTHATSFSITTGNDPVLELNLSSNLLELNLTPKPNTPVFNTTDLTVTAGTNNLTGYTLYMNVDNPNLTRTESLANNTTPSINSLVDNTTGYTEAEFTTNSWGYHLSGDTNYFAIPTTQLQLSTSTEPVNANSTTITFASKVDMTQPAGEYSTSINFIALTNTPYPTMQDIDSWRGSLIENHPVKAIDSRDGKYYYVTKLRTANSNPRATTDTDGNKYQIWMTENLDLDLSPNTPLTSEATDLNSASGIYTNGYTVNSNGVIAWTPLRGTTNNVADTQNDNATPYSYNPGNVYYYPGESGTAGSSTCNNTANTTSENDCNYWHAGNYYNWNAAVASNNTSSQTANYQQAENSICPKGWKLPAGLTAASNTYSDFNYLLVQQGIAKNYVGANTNATWSPDNTSGYLNIQKAPLYILRSGFFYLSSLNLAGAEGYLWSSTASSSTDGYGLGWYSSGVNPAHSYNRHFGFPVRCVARDTVISDLTYMQDFANLSSFQKESVKNSMTVNTQYQLKDKRDNKTYWISKLRTANSNPNVTASSDGNKYQIWMTQNLDLDLSTSTPITSETSDINSSTSIYTNGYTTNNSIISWTPMRSTTNNVANTQNSNTEPYSYDPGNKYYYQAASGTAASSTCNTANTCNHWHVGNYYNWNAAVASNDTSSQTTANVEMSNSICPKGWKLPAGVTSTSSYSDFNYLLVQYGIAKNYVGATINATWSPDNTNGYLNIQTSPLYILRAGVFDSSSLRLAGAYGTLWSSTASSSTNGYNLGWGSSGVWTANSVDRLCGYSVRCLVR